MKSAREGKRRVDKDWAEPDFDRHPLNEIESALNLLETSWADFLYGLRGHGRHIRAERRPSLRARGLAKVHRILDSYMEQFIGGNRLAIWTALILCVDENIPLPYWLGDAILDIHKRVNREPSSLHYLFGFESKLPADGKRALAMRVKLQWRWRLSSAVNALMVKPGMSKEAAIKKVRDDLHVPYAQRTCREMFDDQERIDREYFDASNGVRTHRGK